MPSCLIIASGFPPVQSGGVYRTVRMAKYLPELGWDLSILTLTQSTFPAGAVVDENLLSKVPAGTLVFRAHAKYPLENLNSIRRLTTGRRVKSSASRATTPNSAVASPKKLGKWQAFKDRISLPFMTPDRLVGWVRPATRLGSTVVRDRDIDLIYSSAPPFSNHLVGRAIQVKSGKPWVADFRDPWLGNTWRPNREGDTWSGKRHRALESEVFTHADRVIFNTERSRRDAVNRFGECLEPKSVVIPNGYDPEDFALQSNLPTDGSVKKQSDREKGPLRIVHTGSFYGRRNVDSLIHALGNLVRDGRVDCNDVRIDLIGNVREHEKQLVADCNVSEMVRLIPPMPHQDCLATLHQADVLLLVQTEAPLCVPGKLYEYIAVGKPIFTLASTGATADMVTVERLGPCIDPDDLEAVKMTVLELVCQHQEGRLNVPSGDAVDRYNGKNQMIEFDRVFRTALSNRSND